MHRRAFVTAAALCVLRARRSGAQPAERLARVGILINSNPQDGSTLVAAFRQGMAEAGWAEGRNLILEYRWAEGDLSRHPRLVAELLAARVDVVVLAGTSAARAAREATTTVPIVVTVLGDAVDHGLVASLARPGANLTGLAWQSSDLVTKQIQILRETVPKLSRLAAMWHSANPAVLKAAELATRAFGITLRPIAISSPGGIAGAFDLARRERADALIVLPSPMFYAHRRQLAELALRHRLPASYEVRAYVDDGGLLFYGPSFPDMYGRAASYVDRILKGATPGDVPMEQPSKFELALNLRAARAIKLAIPPAIQQRADYLVE
jgi:putative ABC transport system substrate-binding protein